MHTCLTVTFSFIANVCTYALCFNYAPQHGIDTFSFCQLFYDQFILTGPLSTTVIQMCTMLDANGGDYKLTDLAPQVQIHFLCNAAGINPNDPLVQKIYKSFQMGERMVGFTGSCDMICNHLDLLQQN